MKKIFNSLKGSAVLVVVLSAVVFSIYATSNFAESEHYSILQDKYEKNIKDEYEKNINNIEDFYDNILNQNSSL